MYKLSSSYVDSQEAIALTEVIAKQYLGMGKEVDQFETELAEYIDIPRSAVVCVNTGTAALHSAIQACGIGSGDEVLVPSITYVASYQAVSATGATPIACEINPSNALLDLEDAKRRLSANTKAIMPVHYASYIEDLESIYTFAREHNLRVIEDAAQAFGCEYKGRRIGSFGDVICFSFDGIKNITSGEGGAIVTQDEQVIARLKDLRLLGVEKDSDRRYEGKRSWQFDVKEQGWRYHMSDIMAAIGRTQLKKIEQFKQQRQALMCCYRERLMKMSGIKLLDNYSDSIMPHILPVRILNGARDFVREFLTNADIQTGLHYFPNHLLTKFKTNYSLPCAEKYFDETLTLPLHVHLNESDIKTVLDMLEKAVLAYQQFAVPTQEEAL